MSATGDKNTTWTLLDVKGQTAVTFTSFIDIDLRAEGQALTYPVENGGFASYNKVESPLDIRLTLGLQGTEADFASALERIGKYKRDAVVLAVVTPAAMYRSMTLEAFSYKRAKGNGAGLLATELTLVEVRQVASRATTTAITQPKNPTSAGKVDTGKTQPMNSLASHLVPD